MSHIVQPEIEPGLGYGAEPSSDFGQMMARAEKASDFLKALSHPSRLLLLCLLAEGERSVTELETSLSLRQPTVSQQLARLRNDGLVATRRQGKTVHYRLANEDVRQVIRMLYEMFCGPARGAAGKGRDR